MKVIAYYLPQFHEIPENSEWWGEGFTEWTNVKKATSLYEGHNQPRIPLEENYYNLLDPQVQKWQVELAKAYGVYGFCFYHYWFGEKKLLERPVENFLKNKELDLKYCISWANESWSNAWEGTDFKILVEQTYGDKVEWKRHFEYLLPYFKDERYIRVDNKPLFIIYRADLIKVKKEMMQYWQELAVENGLLGICFAYQHQKFHFYGKDKDLFDYGIEYQPGFAQLASDYGIRKIVRRVTLKMGDISQKFFGGKILWNANAIRKISYDNVWNMILNYKHDMTKMIPGAFVDWDNSPRHGKNGTVMDGVTVDKFHKYFRQAVINAREKYKKDMIFIFAWNEWAEGGYLEPDKKNGDGYLKTIKEVLIETRELE